MSQSIVKNLLLLCLAANALSGCLAPMAGLAVGAGATVGIATEREGGLSAAGNDLRIKALIADKWFKYNVQTFHQLNLTVDHGRVLITGIVQDPDNRVQAVRLAWQVDGVTQVINEIRIADSESLTDQAQDKWIGARLRTTMTFDRDVQAINYSIDVVDGVVYLMGIAENQEEADYVVQVARDIPHVSQVVSYIKISDRPHTGGRGDTAAPSSSGSATTPSYAPPPDSSATVAPGAAAPPPAVESQSLQPQPVQSEPLH